MSQKYIETTVTVEESEVLLVGTWSGSLLSTDRLLDLDALGVSVEELPEQAKKLLRQPVLPKEVLYPFQALNKRALDQACKFTVGSPIGRVMHPDRGTEFLELMKAVKSDWDAKLAELEPKFGQIARSQIQEISEATFASAEQKAAVIKAVRKVQPDWAVFEASVRFSSTLTAVGAVGKFDAAIYDAIKNSVVAVREGAYAELIREVSVEARDILKLIAGKDAVHPRTVGRVQALVEKLDAMSFLAKGVDQLADGIRSVMGSLPMTSSLKGADFDNFETLLLALVDQRVVFSKLAQGVPLIEVVETGDLFAQAEEEDVALTTTPVTAPVAGVAAPATAGNEVSSSDSDGDAPAVAAPAAAVSTSNEVMGFSLSSSPAPVPALGADAFAGFNLVEQPVNQESFDLGSLGFSVADKPGTSTF